MKPTIKTSQKPRSLLLATAFSLAGFGAQALVLTTTPQVFECGPAASDFTHAAFLAAFDQPGTLLGVHLELSGRCDFVLTAEATGQAGTVLGMTEQATFSISGLPFAALSTTSPAYSVGPFDLAAGASVFFSDSLVATTQTLDLTEVLQIAAYDVSAGAPSSLPFLFMSDEHFFFDKTGSGLFGGSDVMGEGTVRVWYSYDLSPPPPVPEVTTALSAGMFALIGVLVMVRNRRQRSLSLVAPPVEPAAVS